MLDGHVVELDMRVVIFYTNQIVGVDESISGHTAAVWLWQPICVTAARCVLGSC